MKLEFVEVSGFRGFRDKTRFEFPTGFVVFSGRNGAGKSTVLDAVDYALTGTINKFSVRSARGGGLDEHIWWVGTGKADEHYVSVGFIDEQGQRSEVRRSRSRGLHSPQSDTLAQLCGSHSAVPPVETLMQTSLIRDEFIVALSIDLPEQARFAAVRAALGGLVGPDYSDRTSAILRAANFARDEQSSRLDAAQAELGRCLSDLTEARSTAERSPDITEALRTIEGFALSLPSDPRERSDALRRFVADRKQAIQELEIARQQSDELLPRLSHLRSPDAAQEFQRAQSALDAAVAHRESAGANLVAVERADESERESDRYAAQLAALIEHGSNLGLEEGHCPLCAAFRTDQEFTDAIASARERLAAQGVRLAASSKAVAEARAVVTAADQAVISAQQHFRELVQLRLEAEQKLAEFRAVYEKHSFQGAVDDPAASQILLLEELERLARLERSLYILDASAAIDRVATLETRVGTLRERVELESIKLGDSERASESARQIDNGAKTVANQILAEQFDTVMPLLKELYRRLRPHSDWLDIESDFGGKVRASLNFTVGEGGHNPQFLFSSGQRRAMGLAFLLAVHLSRRWCRWQTLLLDDPVQHIDDYRALNLVEVLAAIRRTGRQVVIAVEDVALADLLCRRLRSSVGDIGRRFDLQTSRTGTSEIANAHDIYPMPREILRPARAS